MSDRLKRLFRRISTPPTTPPSVLEVVKFYSNPGTFETQKRPNIKSSRPFDFKEPEKKKADEPWGDFAESYRKIMGKKEDKT